MKINYLTKFLNKRYLVYKLNLKAKQTMLFKPSTLSYNVVFFNFSNMKNKQFLAIYLFLLDIFYYKAPVFLTSWLIYRGKTQTKISLLGGLIINLDSILQFLREFIFFIFLRNFDIRNEFVSALKCAHQTFCLQFFIRSSFFNYNLRPLFLVNLGKQILNFSIFFDPFISFYIKNFISSLFVVVFSFYFFLFEDSFIA